MRCNIIVGVPLCLFARDVIFIISVHRKMCLPNKHLRDVSVFKNNCSDCISLRQFQIKSELVVPSWQMLIGKLQSDGQIMGRVWSCSR